MQLQWGLLSCCVLDNLLHRVFKVHRFTKVYSGNIALLVLRTYRTFTFTLWISQRLTYLFILACNCTSSHHSVARYSLSRALTSCYISPMATVNMEIKPTYMLTEVRTSDKESSFKIPNSIYK